ncbi:MAG TPA: SUF system NifU family Fe-S cluster assembly protein [Acidiferrobacterales bacterium]|jgi:nitrogen fixation NifU-like protein
MNTDLRSLYEQVVLDHNRKPRNFQHRPEGATRHAHGFNPVCNDEFSVRLKVEDGVIRDIGFDGAGCAISTASCSLMTEAVKGRPVAEAERLFRGVQRLLTENAADPDLGKLKILAGVCDYPMRVKCATLAWHVLHAALAGKDETVSTEDQGPPPPAECAVPEDEPGTRKP